MAILTTEQANLVRAEAARISDLGVLGDKPRLNEIFTYLVEEELEGRGEALKAYSVAIDAMGKPESFDPAQDSSVRVAMYSLRKALEAFNAADANRPVTITIPTGTYRPAFLFSDERTAGRLQAGLFDWPKNVLEKRLGPGLIAAALLVVLAMAGTFILGGGKNDCQLARPLIVVEVSTMGETSPRQERWKEVLQSELTSNIDIDSPFEFTSSLPSCDSDIIYKLVVEVTDFEAANAFVIQGYYLYRVAGGERLLSNTNRNPVSSRRARISAIGSLINKAIPPSGILIDDILQREWYNSAHLERFQCEIRAVDALSFPQEEAIEVLGCLNRHLKASPNDVKLLELIASVEDDFFYFLDGKMERIERSKSLFDRVLRLDPTNFRGNLQLLSQLRREKPINHFRIEDVLQELETNYPVHHSTYYYGALTKGFTFGEWRDALAYAGNVEWNALEPHHESPERYLNAAIGIIEQDWQPAYDELMRNPKSNVRGLFEVTILLGQGKDKEASEAYQSLLAEFELTDESALDLLDSRNYHASIDKPLREALLQLSGRSAS